MLRKTISGFLALAMLLSLCFQLTAGAENFVKEWEFDGTVSGFGGNNSTLSSVSGKLVQTVTTAKNNTWLLSPNNLGVDAAVYKYLKMSVKNDTTAAGSLAFEATGTEKSTFSGTFTALGTVPNDGEFHDYIIDLSEYSDWAGTISRFRLRLTAWNCEGTVEVDYIKLSDVGVPPAYGISINSLNAVSDKPMGQSISLTAAAVDGTPDSVEYFANGVSLGSANAAPYTVSWTPQQTGGYHITAAADFGQTRVTSESVYVHVYDSTLIENSACYWQFANSTQSFGGNNSTLTSENGCLVQTVEVGKNNSFLVSPSGLGIDADSYKYIKLRVAGEYTKNGSLAVQWITESDTDWDASWADANTKTLNLGSDIVPCDGKFYDYTIDLSDNAGWSGTVTRLRIKVTPWNDTEEMMAHIDYIRVSDTAGDGIDASDIPKPTAVVSFSANTELSSLQVFDGAMYTDDEITGTPDGKFTLPAGVYTYTARPAASSYSNLHRNFIVTAADIANGYKNISIELPSWLSPGYWQTKTIFLPSEEMTNTFFADPLPDMTIDTPAFTPGRRINSYTTQEELDTFMAEKNAANNNMWATVIGHSDNNLNIHLAIFSKGAQNNAAWSSLSEAGEALHALGKPIVWISAQVHGNELSGGESALQLINELSGEWGNEVLDKVSVVVLPRQNPKGAMFNRRTPNGENDINRDRVKLELPETRAINSAYWAIRPHVATDAHEYGAVPGKFGGKYTFAAHDLLTYAANNKNIPQSIRNISNSLYITAIHSELAKLGMRSAEYYDGTLASKLTQGGPNPTRSTGGCAMFQAVSILTEQLIPGAGFNSRIHFERRVKACLTAQKTIIEVTAENAAQVKSVVEAERRSLIDRGNTYDENNTFVIKQSLVQKKIDFDYIDMETMTIKTANVNYGSYTDGEVVKAVARPTAYILPKTEAFAEAASRLAVSGAEMYELPAGTTVSSGLQSYRVTSSTVESSLNQGVYNNIVTADIESCGAVTFENGAYLIPMNQARANLIAYALEPEFEASYVTYRIIDAADTAVGDTLPYYRYAADDPETLIPHNGVIIKRNASGNVIAKINSQNAINADAILASYDNAGRLLGVSFNTISGTYGECGLGAGASENAASARVYVWDNMSPVLTFDAQNLPE